MKSRQIRLRPPEIANPPEEDSESLEAVSRYGSGSVRIRPAVIALFSAGVGVFDGADRGTTAFPSYRLELSMATPPDGLEKPTPRLHEGSKSKKPSG
jgi:hypothetical protein